MSGTRTGRKAAILLPLLLVATMLGFVPAQAATTTQNITPSADTYVTPLSPDAEFSTNQKVRVDDDGRLGLFKFAVPAAPAGKVLTSAKFEVGVITGPAVEIEVWTTGNSWAETTTWNTLNVGPNNLAGKQTVGAGGTLSIPNVPTVDPNANQSILVKRVSTGDVTELASKENTTTSIRPKLILTWDDAVTNTAPSVNAGADGTTTVSTPYNLDATVTDDGKPTGSTVTQTWSKVSGPGTVAFGSTTAVDTTATFSEAGTYVLKLTATDGTASSSDQISITVNPDPVEDTRLEDAIAAVTAAKAALETTPDANLQTAQAKLAEAKALVDDLIANPDPDTSEPPATPTVSAGPDKTVTMPGKVTLDATSTDAASYAWSKVSGPGTVTFDDATQEDTAAAFSVDGSYVLRLTVTNAAGTATDDVAVTVNPAVVTPTKTNLTVTAAGVDNNATMANITEGDQVRFNGTFAVQDLESDDEVYLKWYVDDKFAAHIVYWGSVANNDPTMDPGTYAALAPSNALWTATPGNHTLKLVIDESEVNDESNESDNVFTRSFTVAESTTDPDPEPVTGLPYGSDSFFQSRVDGPNVPIDAALTAEFKDFMARHEDQGGKGVFWPKINQNPGWSGHNHVSKTTDPIWKLTGTSAGTQDSALNIVRTQGVYLADSVWSTVPTGTQDRLLVIYDKPHGYTVQCADVVPNMSARTWTASNCGIMWHTSNGLDRNNPQSDDNRNWTSRGRLIDAMQVPRSELDAAKAANRGLGRVMHIFFVATCGADGHVHPMTNEENKTCWNGNPVTGPDNDGGLLAEGTRFRIKPSVDLVGRGITGEALVLARTLQQNGGVIGDNSGGPTQLKIGPPEDYTGTNLATDYFKGKLDFRTDFEIVQPGWQG